MAKKLQAVLDTNVIVSAIIYRGKPRQILELAYEENFQGIISPILFSELTEVLIKKFSLSAGEIGLVEEEIKESFKVVHPKDTINIQKDMDDNRVLEAAVEGRCDYIITGDKELLDSGVYKEIKIVTPDQFLKFFNEI